MAKTDGCNPSDIGSIPIMVSPGSREIQNRKKENIIKLIDKRSLQVLLDYGFVKEGSLKGIAITSKGKKSKGKKYYAKDKLAFTAWKILGYSPDDRDYQKWIEQSNKAKERRK